MSKNGMGCLKSIVGVGILGLAGGLLYYFLRDNEQVQHLQDDLEGNLQGILEQIPNIDLFHAEDPFVNLNGTYAWPNKKQGLQLTVRNCLDSRWDEYFNQAISDWDGGSPDCLTLTTEEGEVDFDCTPEDDIMKVCNGDYGETDWKGINKVLLNEKGVIYASAARMNEFFLNDAASGYEKQYTMCHEIGHGFGLAHTDENFYNINQGNCLDYTSRPKNNMHPDELLFDTLYALYGSVDGSTPSNTTDDPSNVENPDTGNNKNTEGQNSGQSGVAESNVSSENGTRGLQSGANNVQNNIELPSWILEASKQIDAHFAASSTKKAHHHKGWRLLRQSRHAVSHEFNIGNGHKIQVHVLLAQDSL